MKKKTIIKLLELIDWCQEHETVMEDLTLKGFNLEELGQDLFKELKKSPSLQEDIVTISDNGDIKNMERSKAEKLYFEAMMCSDGSAQCRYSNIYCQLKAGFKFCTDEK